MVTDTEVYLIFRYHNQASQFVLSSLGEYTAKLTLRWRHPHNWRTGAESGFPLFNFTDLDVASPVRSNLTTRLDSLVLTEVSQYHGEGVRD